MNIYKVVLANNDSEGFSSQVRIYMFLNENKAIAKAKELYKDEKKTLRDDVEEDFDRYVQCEESAYKYSILSEEYNKKYTIQVVKSIINFDASDGCIDEIIVNTDDGVQFNR